MMYLDFFVILDYLNCSELLYCLSIEPKLNILLVSSKILCLRELRMHGSDHFIVSFIACYFYILLHIGAFIVTYYYLICKANVNQ